MIFDTDVLIWGFRGSESAATRIASAQERHISAITLMELLRGAKDQKETRCIKDFLKDLGFTTLPLAENIGNRAVYLVEEFGLSHGMTPDDAIIASTAIEHRHPLISGNAKHYRHIKNLELVVFKP